MPNKKRTGNESADRDGDLGTPRERGRSGGRRGVSEVVGVILLFGIVIVGIGLILMSGMTATEQVDDRNEFKSAEVSMQEFRGKMSSMAYENDSTAEFELGGDNTEKVGVEQDGYIAFELNDKGDICTANRSMGMVEYEQEDGDVVAYEANGVWKKTGGNGSVMVDPPNIQYRTENIGGAKYKTLNYPLVNVNASQSNFGRSPDITVQDTNDDVREQINRAMCLQGANANKIDTVDNVTISVQFSQFYVAWADYLEQKFGDVATVEVYESNRSVFARDIPLGLDPSSCPDVEPNVNLWVFNDSPDSTDERKYVEVAPNETVFFRGVATDTGPSPCPSIGINGTAFMGDGPSGNGTSTSYNWGTPGVRDVTLKTWDKGGNTNTSTVTVNVTSAADDDDDDDDSSCTDAEPTASLNASPASESTWYDDSVTVSVSETIQFVGYNDEDQDDCGGGPADGITDRIIDGGQFEEPSNETTYSYSEPGTYDVTLFVEDDDGSVATDNVTVVVEGPTSGGNDSDGDGVPDPYDDCPGSDENVTGENGCQALSEEDGGLRVNQSSGTLEILGTQYTQRNVSEGADRKSLDVMFVLDGTGSMDTNDPDRERVEAVQTFVGALDASAGDRAGWNEFRIEFPGFFEPPQDCYNDEIYEACVDFKQGLTDDFDALNDSVENVDEDGGTYIGAGINNATEQLEDSDRDKQIMVVLSDGENDAPDAWEDDAEDLDDRTALRAQEADSEGITIYTIGLGDPDDVPRNLLEDRVANETGGDFYMVTDDSNLADTFDEIAGEEIDPVKRVEYNDVETSIGVNDTNGSRTIDLGELNGVGGNGTASDDIDNGEPEWLLSLTTTVLACEDGEGLGDEVPYEDGDYEKTECDGDTPVDTVDGEDARHEIYRGGDEVPTFEGEEDKPWKNRVDEIVSDRYPEYIEDLDSDGDDEFDLGPNQAIIVLRYSPGNFTVALFEADDTDAPSTCSSAPPTADLNVTPSDTVETGETVDIDGDASADDACSATIDDQKITVEKPGSDEVNDSDEADATWVVPGVYTVTYEVGDSNGGSTTITDVVVVNSPDGCVDNDPEIESVTVSASRIPVGEDVVIEGDARDDDSCGSGTLEEIIKVEGEKIGSDTGLKDFGTPGMKEVNYTVVDDEGNSVSTTFEIEVYDPSSGPDDDESGDDDFVIGIPGSEVVVG